MAEGAQDSLDVFGEPGHTIIVPPGGARVDIVTDDDRADARHQRWRSDGLFFVSVALFASVFAVSLWTAFLSKTVDADTRKTATGILITLIGALGGFLGGRAAK
jgi:hypothetical protein